MIYVQYCGLKEHQKVSSVCVMGNCRYYSKLVCKVCNSKQFHNHNQETNDHLLDLEIILKNQEALKDESYQYHSKILEIYEMQGKINSCRSYLNKLDEILNELRDNYDAYIENLFMIQIQLNQKDFQINADYEQEQILRNLKEESNKDEFLHYTNLLLMEINKLNECIQYQGNETSDNKLFQVACHKQEIQFAQISPDGQDLFFGSNQKLYQYNFQQFNYQQICDISDTTQSFVISKDYQQYYFDYGGNMKIYNRNLNKCEQIKLQICEIDLIKPLSKVIAVTYLKKFKMLFIINLKLKKIIFKLKYHKIVDMHYIENQNLLMVAQPYIIHIIMLNSKFKSQKLEYNQTLDSIRVEFLIYNSIYKIKNQYHYELGGFQRFGAYRKMANLLRVYFKLIFNQAIQDILDQIKIYNNILFLHQNQQCFMMFRAKLYSIQFILIKIQYITIHFQIIVKNLLSQEQMIPLHY